MFMSKLHPSSRAQENKYDYSAEVLNPLRGLALLACLYLFLALSYAPLAEAKDLTNRLGVGYSDQFSESMPSLSIRYYPDAKLGVGAALGVDTKEEESRFGFMAKLYRILGEGFMEDQLNFYMGTGVGLISVEVGGESSSGFELIAYYGAEFFFTGLENLGFSFEAGVGVTSVDSEVRFRTMGDHPLKAGMTFYF